MDIDAVILSGLRAQREKWKKILEFRDLNKSEMLEYSNILKKIEEIYARYN